MNGRNGNGQSAAPGNNPRGAPPLGQYGILHVIGGNDRGKQCELSKVTTNLGRGADQELVLADIAVSRRHVKIHLQQNGYRLQDLGSGNGTLVNGKKVDDVMLCDGDQIELGNTLLRFEHPPSRAEGAAPPAPQYMAPPQMPPPQMPPQMPPPQMAPPQPYAPSPYGTAGGPAMPAPYGTAGGPAMPAPYGTAGAQAMPAPMPMAPPPYMPAPGAAFLATDRSRKLAFSAVAVALALGLGGLAFQVRAATRAPVSETGAVLDLYNTGARHFQAQDFEAAAKSFGDALALAPESPDLKHYVEACKQEGVALGQIKTGKKELEQRRYGAALKTFEQVDKGSVQYDYAQQQARDARREAAKLAYNEARNLSLSDLKGAMGKVNEGLEVDPENPQLLALKSEVASGSTLAARPNDPQPPVIKPPPVRQPPVVKGPPVVKLPRVAKIPKATPEPVRPVPTPTADDGKGRLSSNPGALTAYRARDLGGAINAMNNFAKVNAEPARGRALATVKDLEELRGQLDKAARLEAANPAGAQAAYTSAQALDRRISGGALGSYLGGKVSALQGRAGGGGVAAPRPVSAPTQVSMDPARDGKADKMLQEALGLVKKDPNRARLRCREVMRLYGKEVTHPKYQQAYKLLGTIKGGGDDDED